MREAQGFEGRGKRAEKREKSEERRERREVVPKEVPRGREKERAIEIDSIDGRIRPEPYVPCIK